MTTGASVKKLVMKKKVVGVNISYSLLKFVYAKHDIWCSDGVL
jgi:hypothetical protein